MNWFFDHLPTFVIVFMILSFVRTVVKAAKRAQEQEQRKAATAVPRGGDPDAEERTRRLQAEIRRKIAERTCATPTLSRAQPAMRPAETVPPLARRTPELDPFGGPMDRMMRRIEEMAREAQPAPEPPPVVEAPAMAAVLQRQQQLADQMRALEDARQKEVRRAASIATATAAAATTSAGTRSAARCELLADLRGAKNLRRAVVLREVLGAPVALR